VPNTNGNYSARQDQRLSLLFWYTRAWGGAAEQGAAVANFGERYELASIFRVLDVLA
jgi:hypothetical protein